MLIEREIHGSKMLLDDNDHGLSAQLLKYGTRESEAPYLLEKIVKPGMVALDVGANLGFYAFIEARAGAKVYAVEPDPRNADILRQAVELNGYDITVIERAVGDREGPVEFVRTTRYNQCHVKGAEMMHIPGTETLTVEMERLDDIARRHGITQVDLLRFDIEGYEVEMIEGAQEVLRVMPAGSWMFAELHPRCFKHPVRDFQPTVENIIGHGFKPWYSVEPVRKLASVPPADFASVTCTKYAGEAPLVFFQKCE